MKERNLEKAVIELAVLQDKYNKLMKVFNVQTEEIKQLKISKNNQESDIIQQKRNIFNE